VEGPPGRLLPALPPRNQGRHQDLQSLISRQEKKS
jgi:hypothetical protein